jgi:hypothetical protein
MTFPAFCDATPNPVCGCNGTTYTNACIAHQSHQDVAFAGNCP